MVNALKVEERKGSTQAELKELRKNGRIPGVVYGQTIDSVSIAINEKELLAILKGNPNAIIEMEVPAQGKQSVMISDMQRDVLYRNITHIDFKQVRMDQAIKTFVRLELVGEAQGVKEGGIFQNRLTELEVQCLPSDIPTQITFDVSDLKIGESVTIADIPAPDKVEILADGSEVVALISAPQKPEEDEDTAADEVAEQKEPENDAPAE